MSNQRNDLHRFFLGGHDLEMIEIRALLTAAGLGDRVADFNLAWGARARAYQDDIVDALARGEMAVLIELEDDLSAQIDRSALISIDHHGPRAGAEMPSSLRQLYDLVGEQKGLVWTRRHALVAANDIGHVRGLRSIGATAEEIRAIRDADRAAQGVSIVIEQESRRAVSDVSYRGQLAVVETTAPTSSAVADFMLPEYGGPGAMDLLVIMPDKLAFFGRGSVIERLKSIPGCWYGGALPEYGFWGVASSKGNADGMVETIVEHCAQS